MLPRELVEEFVGGDAAAGLHVVIASPGGFNGFLVVLPFPVEVIGEDIIEGVGGALSSPAGEFLQLRQSLGFDRHGFHRVKVDTASADVK